jgi:hypothetical protein
MGKVIVGGGWAKCLPKGSEGLDFSEPWLWDRSNRRGGEGVGRERERERERESDR